VADEAGFLSHVGDLPVHASTGAGGAGWCRGRSPSSRAQCSARTPPSDARCSAPFGNAPGSLWKGIDRLVEQGRPASSGALEVKHADAVSPAEGTRLPSREAFRLARSSGRQVGCARRCATSVDGWRLMESGSVRGGRGLLAREWVQRARTEPSQRLKVEVLDPAPRPGAGRG
jgi:hypothetical protein